MRPPVGATAAEVMPSTSWIGMRLESALSAVLASWAARIGWSPACRRRGCCLEVDLDQAELGVGGEQPGVITRPRTSIVGAEAGTRARASGPPTDVNTPSSIDHDAVLNYGAVADVELAADEVHGAAFAGWCGVAGGGRVRRLRARAEVVANGAGEDAQEGGARELSHGTPAGR
jgi:hypothetical protein